MLAASLSEGNQELIAASTLVENLPALVEAAARGLAGTNLTVLNGTQGVNEVMAGLVGQGFAILELLKKSATVPVSSTAPVPSGNGTAPALRDSAGLGTLALTAWSRMVVAAIRLLAAGCHNHPGGAAADGRRGAGEVRRHRPGRRRPTEVAGRGESGRNRSG